MQQVILTILVFVIGLIETGHCQSTNERLIYGRGYLYYVPCLAKIPPNNNTNISTNWILLDINDREYNIDDLGTTRTKDINYDYAVTDYYYAASYVRTFVHLTGGRYLVKITCQMTYHASNSSSNLFHSETIYLKNLALLGDPIRLSPLYKFKPAEEGKVINVVCSTDPALYDRLELLWLEGVQQGKFHVKILNKCPSEGESQGLECNYEFTLSRYHIDVTLLCLRYDLSQGDRPPLPQKSSDVSIFEFMDFGPDGLTMEGPLMQHVTAGSLVTFTCNMIEVMRSGRIVNFKYIQWLKDGQNLKEETHYTISNAKNVDYSKNATTKLTFTAKKNDGGIYQCVVHDTLDRELARNVSLHVEYPPTRINMISKVSDVFQGDNLTLHCTSDGSHPDHVIRWLRNDQLLDCSQSANTCFETHVDHLNFSHSYIITVLGDEHAGGYYVCMDEKSAISDDVNITLNVNISISCMNIDDRYFSLQCDSSGTFQLDFQWYYNNSALSKNKTIAIDEFGQFTCEVTGNYLSGRNTINVPNNTAAEHMCIERAKGSEEIEAGGKENEKPEEDIEESQTNSTVETTMTSDDVTGTAAVVKEVAVPTKAASKGKAVARSDTSGAVIVGLGITLLSAVLSLILLYLYKRRKNQEEQ